jgi:hypothetical protein
MAKVLRLADFRRNGKRMVSFDRQELRQLLDVYSRRVATGEWKDYAIDLGRGAAVFSIFRSSFDTPLFSIVKRTNGGRSEFLVMSGRQELKRGSAMGEVLSVFDRPMRLISRRR